MSEQNNKLAISGNSNGGYNPGVILNEQQIAEAQVWLKSVLGQKSGIGSIADGMALIMRAKDLNIPLSTAVEHVHIIQGKTGVDIHILKALCSRAGVTWECIEDYTPQYEYTDGTNVFLQTQLPSYCVVCKSIDEAEKAGVLKPGATIIEPTSGNTGIGLASVAAARGYKIIIIMPETMSVERRQIMKGYGAELVLTEGSKGMKGAIAKADELAATIPGSWIAGQFVNPSNPAAHIASTGPEIWEDTDGQVDYFIAGVGTGGTITGVGQYLKSKKSDVKIIAVEPSSSPVLSKGTAGSHKIQGIGAGFVPQVLDTKVYDEVLPIENEEAFEYGKLTAKKEGFLLGISAGAAVCAAIQVAKRPESKGKNIVVLLPDNGDKYLSTPLFAE